MLDNLYLSPFLSAPSNSVPLTSSHFTPSFSIQMRKRHIKKNEIRRPVIQFILRKHTHKAEIELFLTFAAWSVINTSLARYNYIFSKHLFIWEGSISPYIYENNITLESGNRRRGTKNKRAHTKHYIHTHLLLSGFLGS